VHGDSRVEMRKLAPESVDMIIADFPYGKDIELSEGNEGEKEKVTPYKDGAFETMELVDGLMREGFRVLKEDRVMLCFFDVIHKDQLIKMALDKGFNVCRTPIIWSKTRGTGQPTNPTYYNPSYEMILHLQKGWRKMNTQNVGNVIEEDRVPSKVKVHPTQKPQKLLRKLIELHTLKGELVIDPCAGSGSTLAAALTVGRQAWGCEIEEEFYLKGVNELTKLQKELAATPVVEVDKKGGPKRLKHSVCAVCGGAGKDDTEKPCGFCGGKGTLPLDAADDDAYLVFTPGSPQWVAHWEQWPERHEAMLEYAKLLATEEK